MAKRSESFQSCGEADQFETGAPRRPSGPIRTEVPQRQRGPWHSYGKAGEYGASAEERKTRQEREAELEKLYAQIGKLTTQNEWLKKKSGL